MKITAFLLIAAVFASLVACDLLYKRSITVKPVVLRTIPHDRGAFTQGFLFQDGRLYESIGLWGASSLRCVRPSDGAVLFSRSLPDTLFGEGLALFQDKLVQLTWKSGKAIVYSRAGMEQIGTFAYNGEGWGLTTCGSRYVMSNGSDTLYFRDKNFALVGKLPVRLRGRPLENLNELECVRNRIYANVLGDESIYEINLHDGTVTKIIDCSEIVSSLHGLGNEDVLNGIAWDANRNSFYITGKRWPAMFEITIP